MWVAPGPTGSELWPSGEDATGYLFPSLPGDTLYALPNWQWVVPTRHHFHLVESPPVFLQKNGKFLMVSRPMKILSFICDRLLAGTHGAIPEIMVVYKRYRA